MRSALWFQYTNPDLFGVVGSNTRKVLKVDGYGLMIVELIINIGNKDEPWVLASEVAQVLYVADPAKKDKTCCNWPEVRMVSDFDIKFMPLSKLNMG